MLAPSSANKVATAQAPMMRMMTRVLVLVLVRVWVPLLVLVTRRVVSLSNIITRPLTCGSPKTR